VWAELAGPRGPIPVIGVPSASLGQAHKSEMLARYHVFHITGGDGPARITCIARGLTAPHGPVVEIDRRQLAPAAPAAAGGVAGGAG
jgi:hypothetical protein